MNETVSIIIDVICSLVGFFLCWQMIRLRNNITEVTGQLISAHKTDQTFKNQEFLHYYESNGHIWLSAMDERFKKTLSIQKWILLANAVVGACLLIVSVMQGMYWMAILPLGLLTFSSKLFLTCPKISKEDKENQAQAIENYKKKYPKDATVLHAAEGKAQDKLAGWYLAAKRVSIRTGKLASGKAALKAKEEGKTIGGKQIQMQKPRMPMRKGKHR